jgi:phosphoribosylamine--glycine ligase
MKVLVIGSGGREHALVWKISKSKKVRKIYCAPGNLGTELIAQNIPLQVNQINKMLEFAKQKKIDLTVVGPEIPLIEGITDLFEKNQLKIIGPSKRAAQIEGSKFFSKKLLLKYKIPTAKFACFDDYDYALEFIKTQKYPLVIKADGQCAGKGVAVCKTEKEARLFIKQLMKGKIFGVSGSKVVIEECLVGQEVSFMVATDGTDFISFFPSLDHTRVNDNDRGPNTGGMGAYAPVPLLKKSIIKIIEKKIIGPTITAMNKEGCIYRGILYPGIILTSDGPKVLEFNCRFGDPETQPLMMMLKTDIMDIFRAITSKRIKNLKIKWNRGSAVCVVLTAKGYPGKYDKNIQIYGLNNFSSDKNYIFHAGTTKKEDKILTSGGRVLGITARGDNLKKAIKNVYGMIGNKRIHFSGMHFRKDIGKKGMDKKLWK